MVGPDAGTLARHHGRSGPHRSGGRGANLSTLNQRDSDRRGRLAREKMDRARVSATDGILLMIEELDTFALIVELGKVHPAAVLTPIFALAGGSQGEWALEERTRIPIVED